MYDIGIPLTQNISPCFLISARRVVTMVTGQPSETISKKCAVGPCSLDDNQNTALGLGCTGNHCTHCCTTDGCNISAAQPLTSSASTIVVIAVAIMTSVYT